MMQHKVIPHISEGTANRSISKCRFHSYILPWMILFYRFHSLVVYAIRYADGSRVFWAPAAELFIIYFLLSSFFCIFFYFFFHRSGASSKRMRAIRLIRVDVIRWICVHTVRREACDKCCCQRAWRRAYRTHNNANKSIHKWQSHSCQ